MSFFEKFEDRGWQDSDTKEVFHKNFVSNIGVLDYDLLILDEKSKFYL